MSAEVIVWGGKANPDRLWFMEHVDKIWEGYREIRTTQSLQAAQEFAACQNKEIALRYPSYRIGVRRLLMVCDKRFQEQERNNVREHNCGTVRCDDAPTQQEDQSS